MLWKIVICPIKSSAVMIGDSEHDIIGQKKTE